MLRSCGTSIARQVHNINNNKKSKLLLRPGTGTRSGSRSGTGTGGVPTAPTTWRCCRRQVATWRAWSRDTKTVETYFDPINRSARSAASPQPRGDSHSSERSREVVDCGAGPGRRHVSHQHDCYVADSFYMIHIMIVFFQVHFK